MQINPVVIIIILGLSAITIIATIGAIASNKMKFNYSYLAPLSFLVYLFLGYLISQNAGLSSVILSTGLIGFFDSTVGWQLCLSFNANLGKYKEESLNRPASARIIFVVLLSIVLGFVGHLLANS